MIYLSIEVCMLLRVHRSVMPDWLECYVTTKLITTTS